METLTISLKETFRKGIANSKIQDVCQFGEADYLISTKNQVFHFNAFKDSGSNLSKLNFLFKTSIFIKELNIICAIGSSLPNIVFLSIRSGFPLICEAYRLSSSLYDTIQFSPKFKKLIVSGDSVEIFDLIVEWKLFEIDPTITLVNKLSFQCGRMTSNVFLDEMRQILIIPTLFGISTVDMSNLNGSPNYNLDHAVSNYQLGAIPFQTMAFYNSSKLSKQRSISNIPFKYLITTNSNGDISLWNSTSVKTSHPIHNFKKLNEVSILCEFIDNEFCLFVTESRPIYFVILLDVKTGKTIKLTSFDTKVIKMKILSKNSVSFLTEDFYVVYQLNIPWHLFSKTASNAVAIRRYPTFSNHQKAARVATLFNDGIVSLFSPDVHFLLTEIGTTCSCKIIDFIYDRSSSLRIRDKIISIDNVNEKIFNTQNQSNLDLNANLSTSNLEKNKTVTFNFTANLDDEPKKTQTENNPKSVNFCPSILQLRKRQQIKKIAEIGERFIILLDDGTMQVFNSYNDHFTLSKTVSTTNLISISLTYIRDEDEADNEDEYANYEPVFIGFNKAGELLSFRYDNFDVITRTALTANISKERLCPLFVCLHHRTNSIYALYENQILIIDSSTKKIIRTETINSKPRFASLEDDLLLIVYENRAIELRHLKDLDQTTELIKILENVTFSIVQYETYIIITDDKTVRIGHTFDNCAIFEFPFKIFSAGFINPELDVALGLDFEIMVIKRSLWYPFIEKPFNCTSDSSDPKTENYITAIHNKAVLYNIKEEESNKNEEEILDLESNSAFYSLSYSSSSSSSSSLSQNTCNSLFLMSKSCNKSAVSFSRSPSKIISQQKSTPSIVKLNTVQPTKQQGGTEPTTLINRKKRLPDLKSSEEMMNDKQFMALFKDVGNGLNEGNRRRQSVFVSKKNILPVYESKNDDIDAKSKKNSELDQKIDSKNKNNNSNSKNKMPKTKKEKETGLSVVNNDDDDTENHEKKRIKRKKRVVKKESDEDDDVIIDDNGILDFLKKKQMSLIQQSKSDDSLNTSSLQNDKEKIHHNPKPPCEPLNSHLHPRNQKLNKKEGKDEEIAKNSQVFSEQINTEIGHDSVAANENVSNENNDDYESKSCIDDNEKGQVNDSEEAGNNDNESEFKISNEDSTEISKKEVQANRSSNHNDDDEQFVQNDSSNQISNKDSFGSQNGSKSQIKESHIDSNSNKNEEAENEAVKMNSHKIQMKGSTFNRRPSNARKFMKLGTKSHLTMSSPDLILLQAQLGKVKLTVENGSTNSNSNSDNSATLSESRKNLPLITVHLIQKKISRTKSEYNFVRSVDQSIFKIERETSKNEESGTIGIQIERLMKTRNQVRISQDETSSNNQNQNQKEEKKRTEQLFAIKQLFPNEKQEKKRRPRNNKRLEFIVPKRCDRQPLGNVELAIQVFRPNGNKK